MGTVLLKSGKAVVEFDTYIASVDNNATGDGTTYTLGGTTALTEVADAGSNVTSAGLFTAPVAGLYCFGLRLNLHTDTATALECRLVTNTFSHIFYIGPVGYLKDGSGNVYTSYAIFIYLLAGATAYVTIKTSGGAKTDDILSGTSFSGCLV